MPNGRDDLIMKAVASLRQSARHWEDLMSELQSFQASAALGALSTAEEKRERMHTLLDDYVDQYMVAAKLNIEGGRL